jgi:hypothetical protein
MAKSPYSDLPFSGTINLLALQKRIIPMSYELRSKLDKQATRIELLEEELRCTNQALEEKSVFAAALERDLENIIFMLQRDVSNEVNTSMV